MYVLYILIDLVKQTDLDHIVNDGKQTENHEDQVGCVPQILDRSRHKFFIYGHAENVVVSFSLASAGRD